jgi:hypothetical protein
MGGVRAALQWLLGLLWLVWLVVPLLVHVLSGALKLGARTGGVLAWPAASHGVGLDGVGPELVAIGGRAVERQALTQAPPRGVVRTRLNLVRGEVPLVGGVAICAAASGEGLGGLTCKVPKAQGNQCRGRAAARAIAPCTSIPTHQKGSCWAHTGRLGHAPAQAGQSPRSHLQVFRSRLC